MARATIQPRDPARPNGEVPQPEPNLRADNSGRRVTSEGDLFVLKSRNQAGDTGASRSDVHDLAGVQDVGGIKCPFNRTHDADRFPELADQKLHLPIADPVFTRARPLHGERARYHSIVKAAGFGDLLWP